MTGGGSQYTVVVTTGTGNGSLRLDVIDWAREHMAAYKVPKFWRFTEVFPMTVTGKIQKYRLRELAVEELRLQAEAGEKTA